MSINIKTDRMRAAILFHKSVLFTPERIPDNDVPDGWHRYDLRGSIRNARDAGKPTAISDHAYVNRIGSVLSPVPLKREGTAVRRVNGQFLLLGSTLTLREYCRDNGLDFPAKHQSFHIRPASSEEAGLFYTLPPEEDAKRGAIGHVRIDFGGSGSEFHHSWWPRGPEELNTPAFKQELGEVVDELRLSVLKGLGSMHSYCSGHGGKIKGGACCQNYGYVVETDRYLYRLRCNPTPVDYQAYLSCFDKQAQTLGLTEKGRQALKDAAEPSKAHTYSWYAIERIGDPDLQKGRSGSLEEAVQAYSAFDHADKRLGVTKDSIAAVDLVICLNGREWLSDDWTKLDSFKDDPMVSAVVSTLQAELGVKPLVGRVSFASGERIGYTDPEEYIKAVREELPCHSTSGFRYETLTDDPEVRKAVDDILYDLYGDENPRPLENYGGMTMGGMS